MLCLGKMKTFFQEDEIGQKMKEIGAELVDLMKMMRVRVRGHLRDYIKKLLAEDS